MRVVTSSSQKIEKSESKKESKKEWRKSVGVESALNRSPNLLQSRSKSQRNLSANVNGPSGGASITLVDPERYRGRFDNISAQAFPKDMRAADPDLNAVARIEEALSDPKSPLAIKVAGATKYTANNIRSELKRMLKIAQEASLSGLGDITLCGAQANVELANSYVRLHAAADNIDLNEVVRTFTPVIGVELAVHFAALGSADLSAIARGLPQQDSNVQKTTSGHKVAKPERKGQAKKPGWIRTLLRPDEDDKKRGLDYVAANCVSKSEALDSTPKAKIVESKVLESLQEAIPPSIDVASILALRAANEDISFSEVLSEISHELSRLRRSAPEELSAPFSDKCAELKLDEQQTRALAFLFKSLAVSPDLKGDLRQQLIAAADRHLAAKIVRNLVQEGANFRSASRWRHEAQAFKQRPSQAQSIERRDLSDEPRSTDDKVRELIDMSAYRDIRDDYEEKLRNVTLLKFLQIQLDVKNLDISNERPKDNIISVFQQLKSAYENKRAALLEEGTDLSVWLHEKLKFLVNPAKEPERLLVELRALSEPPSEFQHFPPLEEGESDHLLYQLVRTSKGRVVDLQQNMELEGASARWLLEYVAHALGINPADDFNSICDAAAKAVTDLPPEVGFDQTTHVRNLTDGIERFYGNLTEMIALDLAPIIHKHVRASAPPVVRVAPRDHSALGGASLKLKEDAPEVETGSKRLAPRHLRSSRHLPRYLKRESGPADEQAVIPASANEVESQALPSNAASANPQGVLVPAVNMGDVNPLGGPVGPRGAPPDRRMFLVPNVPLVEPEAPPVRRGQGGGEQPDSSEN